MSVIYFLVLLPLAHCNQDLSITEYIQKHGYQAETHHFVTPDGYILGAQRIPSKKSEKVVLLVHGLGGNAENFILLGPPDAMAFYFADRGYDVWMFNARGTGHSRRHQTLNANWDRKKYWNFSWHELGIYDLPTTINYILNKTGMDQLFYVSHSMGGTMFYVMLSERPEMNDKIRAAALLAPSSFLSTTQSPIFHALTKLQPFLEKTLELFNWYELPVPNGEALLRKVLYNFCKPPSMQDLCLDVVYFFAGAESGLINKTLLPRMLQYSPASSSTKQLAHYGQLIRNGGFSQYDHGVKTNMKLYNNKNPPSYNLSNVKVPLAYFYAVEDPYSNAKMAEVLFKYIPNIVLKYQVPVLGWNHLDYLLAYNAKVIINDKIEEVFQSFTNN